MPTDRKMWLVTALVGLLLWFELWASYVSHSVALLSDAAHVGTDLLATLITVYAQRIARRPSTKAMSFGYSRGTVISAFVNGITLIMLSLLVLGETVLRFLRPVAVQSMWMLFAAAVSLIINAVIVVVLYRDQRNLNMRGALVHFAGDALVSCGVILSAVGIWLTGWEWLDPAVSMLLVIIMIFTSWKIVDESLVILMEGTPRSINVDQVTNRVLELPNVIAVHDIHVWGVSDRDFAASLHVVVGSETMVSHTERLVDQIETMLFNQYSIVHTSIQLESGENPRHHGFPHLIIG